jgi:hypothetical protein
MGDLPAPNPALARKVWDSMARPSTRRVATKLRQAGIPVSHQTINRWRRNQWRPLERAEHPLETARAQLDDAVPVLTGDPLTTAEVLVEESAAEREDPEQLTEGQRLHEAARGLAMAVTLAGEAFLRQPEIIVNKPGELALLFRSLAACVQAASAAFAQATSGPLNDGSAAEPLSAPPPS